ncbi:hypothetical protein IP88_07910 [alpha proteobacterium AAP81b]|nr:hypothetical protein IP88_07910 [alpha proteobacterium AAP81b]
MTSLTTAAGVPFVRSEDAAFADLADWPYAPRYLDFEGLRLAYVDEGPRDGPVALLMHGMPTWGYLNRHIIAALVAAGWRCIAADHIGFGRSDKVTDPGWYSITRHMAAHAALVAALDLQNATIFVQDWGGPIGLAQVADAPERFDRIVVMNTWLHHDGFEYTPAIRRWNAGWNPGGLFAEMLPDPLTIGWFMQVALGNMDAAAISGIVRDRHFPQLPAAAAATRAGYDAPFAGLGNAGLTGARRFPLSLPFVNPEGGAAARQAAIFAQLAGWTKPIHFVWGGADDVFTADWGRAWAARFPQASFDLLPDAGHFLQDTHGAAIAAIMLGHIAGG